MEEAGKKIHINKKSGFSGRGFRFDENEDQLVPDRKKFQKIMLNLQDDSDEETLGVILIFRNPLSKY